MPVSGQTPPPQPPRTSAALHLRKVPRTFTPRPLCLRPAPIGPLTPPSPSVKVYPDPPSPSPLRALPYLFLLNSSKSLTQQLPPRPQRAWATWAAFPLWTWGCLPGNTNPVIRSVHLHFPFSSSFLLFMSCSSFSTLLNFLDSSFFSDYVYD